MSENVLDLQYTELDAEKLEFEAGIANGVLLLSLLLYAFKALPLLLLIVIISIAITRWMICVHELFHILPGNDVHPFVRMFLIPFTPLNIGYEEYRKIHMSHHKYTASEEDPEAFHIRGTHLETFLQALMFPEKSSINYLREHGLESIDSKDVFFRLTLFAGVLILFKAKFIIFWVFLRLAYGLNIWIFFHGLHVKDGVYGVYPRPLPEWLAKIYGFVYGYHSLYATMNHDVHHQWPKVAWWNLSKLRSKLDA